MSNAEISGNRSSSDGGALCNWADYAPATLTLQSVTIANNGSSRYGGAIYNRANQNRADQAPATLIVQNAVISGNGAGMPGGAIRNQSGRATLTNTTISGNSTPREGGAIFTWAYATLTLENVTIAGNSSGAWGGGIFSSLTDTTLTNVTISENSAAYGGGGGHLGDGSLTISDATVSGNSAGYDGGGIESNSGTVTITNTTISGNSAAVHGGGIMNRSAALTIANTTISGNTAKAYGGGINLGYDPSTLTNVTIVQNKAGYTTHNNIFAPSIFAVLRNSILGDYYDAMNPASSHNLIGGDPKLGPLADNGGPTLSHALLPGSPAIDAGSNELATAAGLTRDQRGAARFFDGNRDGTATVDLGAVEFGALVPEVVGRYVFYTNSAFDGGNPAADENDASAIASDKRALLPGQIASFANYTSYSRGLNGIMVDILGIGDPSRLGAGDFLSRVGNSVEVNGWTPAPSPKSVTVVRGAGTSGSDRVTLLWKDGAISNQWLQVTVLANAATGLGEPDVFYFGNAIGEAGNAAHNAIVDAADEALAKDFPHDASDPAAIDDPYDYNRDRLVDQTDQDIARGQTTTPPGALRLIVAPVSLDDAYEANNTRGEAYSPGYNWEQTWLSAIAGPGVQRDDDWYAISVESGNRRLIVDLSFLHWSGNINLELVDAAGAVRASSTAGTDHEHIDYLVPTLGTWYLRVFGPNAGNTYDLRWQTYYVRPGDANLDGRTDVSDLNVWMQYRFHVGTDWSRGDFNGDGKTDVSDLNLWNQYKFTPAPGGLSEDGDQVAAANVLALGKWNWLFQYEPIRPTSPAGRKDRLAPLAADIGHGWRLWDKGRKFLPHP